MTSQETALADLTRVLSEGAIPYMLIGGLANIIWGEPRSTLDIDVTVWVVDAQIPATVDLLGRDFRILVERPADFISLTRVLPLESASGVRVDVIFGLLSFEQDAIGRAVTVEVAGIAVKVCTAEDLILMKIIFRPRSRSAGCPRHRRPPAIISRSRVSGTADPRAESIARAAGNRGPLARMDGRAAASLTLRHLCNTIGITGGRRGDSYRQARQ